jgi:hypothetical protein
MSVPLRLALPLLGLVAAGCSAPVVDEDDMADASEGSTQGIVLVEELVPAQGAPQTNVSAKFMRVAAGTDADVAERVVGSRLDLPQEVPGCAVLPHGGADETASTLARGASITLLDAGDDVRLTAGDQLVPLDRRAFPDVGGAVFGQFYTSRDAQTVLPAPAHYVLEISGSAEMERLLVEGDAPAPLAEVEIVGRALDDETTLHAGADAVVRWQAGGDASDQVYVDVMTVDGGGLRCLFSDRGEGTLPGSLLRSDVLGALPAAVTVAVHRVRQRPVGTAANGFLDGEMRFDLGVVGHASISH